MPNVLLLRVVNRNGLPILSADFPLRPAGLSAGHWRGKARLAAAWLSTLARPLAFILGPFMESTDPRQLPHPLSTISSRPSLLTTGLLPSLLEPQ